MCGGAERRPGERQTREVFAGGLGRVAQLRALLRSPVTLGPGDELERLALQLVRAKLAEPHSVSSS